MTVPTVQSSDNSDMQVFQSVPTHDDMMALSHQLKEAKRGQARLQHDRLRRFYQLVHLRKSQEEAGAGAAEAEVSAEIDNMTGV